MDSEQRKAIEDFLLDIDILDNLNVQLNQFNVFDILKISKAEIRHSNVLSWLLTPNENHGLGDIFLRKFMQYCTRGILLNDKSSKLNLMNTSLMDYSDITVHREWNDIDILIVSKSNKIVVCIENKTVSKESKRQLKKYYDIIGTHYSDYDKVYMFLTPNGDEASDTDNWILFDYGQILSILEKSMELKKENINLIVYSFLEQYIKIVRRELLMDRELISICTDIYKKHKKALDLIFEYKEDFGLQIKNIIEESLSKYDDLIIDSSNKTYIRFTTNTIDNCIEKCGSYWSRSGRVLLYEFQNRGDKLVLKLIIGPTKEEYLELRKKLFYISGEHKELFKGRRKELASKFNQIYATEVVQKNVMESEDLDIIREIIEIFLDKFRNNEMKIIDEIISKEFWK